MKADNNGFFSRNWFWYNFSYFNPLYINYSELPHKNIPIQAPAAKCHSPIDGLAYNLGIESVISIHSYSESFVERTFGYFPKIVALWQKNCGGFNVVLVENYEESH